MTIDYVIETEVVEVVAAYVLTCFCCVAGKVILGGLTVCSAACYMSTTVVLTSTTHLSSRTSASLPWFMETTPCEFGSRSIESYIENHIHGRNVPVDLPSYHTSNLVTAASGVTTGNAALRVSVVHVPVWSKPWGCNTPPVTTPSMTTSLAYATTAL